MFGISVRAFSMVLVTAGTLALPATASTMLSSVDNGTISRVVTSGGIGAGARVAHDPDSQSRTIFDASFGLTAVTAGYFVFDLSGFSGTATQATLDVELAGVTAAFSDEFILNLRTVSSDPADFDVAYNESSSGFDINLGVDPLGTGNDLMSDIAGGPLAGRDRLTVPQGSVGAGPVSISLTASGLSALNGAVGDLFVLGFDTGSLGGATVNSEKLTIEGLAPTTTPVPGPLSGVLLLTAMGGLCALRRRAGRSLVS